MDAIQYIIEVIICSGLLLVAYRWLLAKKVRFGLCRAFIIISMLMAVAIPAMNVPLFPEKTIVQQRVLTGFDFIEAELEGTVAADSAAELRATEEVADETNSVSRIYKIKTGAGIILKVIYLLVALASLSLTIYNIIKIQRLRRRSKLTHTGDYTLAEHEEIKTPFSFLLTIFMGFNYEPQERLQILTHEASHVRHRHSFERIFLSVLRSVFWFNPFFWMAEKDLEEVQEWEADKDVLSEGYELKTYRTTIFKQLFGYNPDISCGLNHSLTKQRFIMMTQSRRGKGAWIRLAATLPIIAAVFVAFGCGTKEAKASEEVLTDLTNGTEKTYIDICPPCDATVSNSFNAGKAGRSHSGIDYVLDEGDPVYAVADGVVSAITRDNSNGLMLTLKHADGFETRYAHLSRVEICTEISFDGPNVKVNKVGSISTDADHSDLTVTGGGKVYKGQLIGFAGSTGRATGPHLHFEVRHNGSPIDPSPFFTSDKPVKGPFIIEIIEGTKNPKPGEEYFIICNGKLAHKEDIGKLVEEFFTGTPMNQALVHMKAQNHIPVGVITDIKEQLRSVRALRIRYETDESAIEKRMPPAVQKTEERSDEPRYMTPEEFANAISRRNHIFFKINSKDKVLLGTDRSVRDASEKPYIVNIEDFDIDILKRMISNPENKITYPEYATQEFTLPDGSSRQLRVSNAMVSLQTDRGTSYEGYTKAMECITTAYKELREELSSEIFGKTLANLSDAEMQVIYQAVPMNISEAEPKYVPATR